MADRLEVVTELEEELLSYGEMDELAVQVGDATFPVREVTKDRDGFVRIVAGDC
jgi:hypothetical protein